MRKERITQKKAQSVWDSIRQALNTPQRKGTYLPAIDMTDLFAGKKSLNVSDLLQKIVPFLNNGN